MWALHFRERGAAEAALERFEVGQRTMAYYQPRSPGEACLIRRPSIAPYLAVLLPIIVASGLVAFFRRTQGPREIESIRRVGLWIAIPWHTIGILAAGHYFWLAGNDFSGAAMALFGIYLQLGLIPVAAALPPSRTAQLSRRFRGAIGMSLAGTFFGLWLGLFAGWIARTFFSAGAAGFLKWWGCAMAVTVGSFALLGLRARWKVGREVSQAKYRQAGPIAD